MLGDKFDNGKPDWTLIPWVALEPVVKVLEFGAAKYSRDNWKHVSNARRRYLAAAYRHLNAISDGEWIDNDKMNTAGEVVEKGSKLPHAAHAICCLLFLLWFGEDNESHN